MVNYDQASRRSPALATPLDTCQQHYDCLVIGGGIMGLSAARCLQEQGWRVLVLDRSTIGEQAAGSRNGGQLIPGMLLSRTRRLFPHTPNLADTLVRESYRTLDTIEALASRNLALGCDIGFRRHGTAAVYRSHQSPSFTADQAYLAAQGFPLELCEDTDTIARATGVQGFTRMVVNPLGGMVNPRGLLRLEAEDFLNKGGHILPTTSVTNIRSAAGSMTVQTSQGALQAPHVIIAAGAGLEELCRKTGLDYVKALVPKQLRLSALADVWQDIKNWPDFQDIKKRSMTVATHMLRVSPLPMLQSMRLAVSTPGGNCDYWRVDTCGRLQFGGDAFIPGAFEISDYHLQKRLELLFPEVAEALQQGQCQIEERWGGQDTATTSAFPYPARITTPDGATITILTGGNGEGNITGRTIARLTADAMTHQDENFFGAFAELNKPFIGGKLPVATVLWLEHVLEADGLASALQERFYGGRA